MLKFLLFPNAVLYDGITRLRNYFYDIGKRGSIQFDANVISVGNLTVGGTGKTPHIEYLIRLLKDNYKVATLSRGYGRKTKGFLLADETASAKTLGDEPFQYYQKYGKEITVSVGEERALAIPSILFERPETQVILLDDAYQHRAVRPLVNILLCDYNRPFYTDYVLPMGRLREARKGANRADVVVVSKCPQDISSSTRTSKKEQILRYTKKDTPVFFSSIRYGEAKDLYSSEAITVGTKVVVFSALANPEPFIAHCKQVYKVDAQVDFPDHHDYSKEDIEKIMAQTKDADYTFVTTEKDRAKLIAEEFKGILKGVSIVYIPIEVYFLERENEFNQLILTKGIQFLEKIKEGK